MRVHQLDVALPRPSRRPNGPLRLELAPGMLELTQERLRALACGVRESLVLWAGRPNGSTSAVISHLMEPDVEARFDQLSVSASGRAELAGWLVGQRLLTFADLHTHPTVAFLSEADRRAPYSVLPGFLSVVIPEFASGAPGEGWRYYMRTAVNWTEVGGEVAGVAL